MFDDRNIVCTIAICTYNRAAYLSDTLAELYRQRYDKASVEILVVNNNSTDYTVGMLKEASEKFGDGFHWVIEKAQGLSHARNLALQEARGRYVVFIDDDVYLNDGFIQSWVDFLNFNDGIAAAGGAIMVHFDAGQPEWFPMVLKQMLGYHKPFRGVAPYRGGVYPHGGNMAIMKNLGREIDGFNPQLGRSGKSLAAGEEKDFFRRIKNAGGTVLFNPDAVLHHRIGSDRLTTHNIYEQGYGIGRSDRVMSENLTEKIGWTTRQLIKTFATVAIALVYLISLQPAKAETLVKFRISLIKGYFGM